MRRGPQAPGAQYPPWGREDHFPLSVQEVLDLNRFWETLEVELWCGDFIPEHDVAAELNALVADEHAARAGDHFPDLVLILAAD